MVLAPRKRPNGMHVGWASGVTISRSLSHCGSGRKPSPSSSKVDFVFPSLPRTTFISLPPRQIKHVHDTSASYQTSHPDRRPYRRTPAITFFPDEPEIR